MNMRFCQPIAFHEPAREMYRNVDTIGVEVERDYDKPGIVGVG